jgi:hypothetical protein
MPARSPTIASSVARLKWAQTTARDSPRRSRSGAAIVIMGSVVSGET